MALPSFPIRPGTPFGPVRVDQPGGVTIRPFEPQAPIHFCAEHIPQGMAPVATLPPIQREVPAPPRIAEDGTIESIGVSRQRLAGLTELMWEAGQTLRVKIMGGTPTINAKIRQYAEEWTTYANIRFEWVGPGDQAEIRIGFGAKGNWSVLGRTALLIPFDFQTMNFESLADDSPEWAFSRLVLHEFGHALGLIHEHQSPAAGIPWNREKVYDYYAEREGWDRAQVDAQVFAKYDVQHTNYTVYDQNSIMHYWVPPELTMDGVGFGGNTNLSDRDKEFIGNWYPRPPSPSDANGVLRTGDDCDEIDFAVQYGVPEVADGEVEFVLSGGARDMWWKKVEVPVGGGDYRMLEVEKREERRTSVPRGELDVARPLRFWKAKFGGAKTLLGFSWDVLTVLPPKSRLSLTWRRDRC